jgi:hypothetical protein
VSIVYLLLFLSNSIGNYYLQSCSLNLLEVNMKLEHIKQLKAIEKEAEKLEPTIIAMLLDKDITIDDLLKTCLDKKVNIPGACLNSIGLIFSKGGHDLTQKEDTDTAFKLYKFAADNLNHPAASGNCAQYYFDGRADINDNDLAQEYCTKAMSLGADKNLLLAKILYEKCEIVECAVHIKARLNDSSTKEHEKIKFREILVECLTSQLNLLFRKINDDALVEDQLSEKIANSVVISEQPVESAEQFSLPGWFNISNILDGFDITSCGKITAQLEIAILQLKIADMAHELAKKQLEDAREKKMPKEVITTLVAKEKELLNSYTEWNAKKEALEKDYQVYIDPIAKTLKRQYQTEMRFFDPSRTKEDSTRELALEFQQRRLNEEADLSLINVTGTPTRRLITAERSTVEASTSCFGVSTGSYANRLGWAAVYKKRAGDKEDYTHPEKISLGSTEFQYRLKANAHHNHISDFYMESGHGTYADTLKQLNRVTGTTDENANKDNEIKLARLMLKYTEKGEAVTLETLKAINPKATVNDVNDLNRILYHCFVKEIASWMLSKDDTHKLPLAIPQARAIKLIVLGYLSIEEVFAPDAPYGIFTGTNLGINIDKVRDKIVRITQLYEKAVLEHHKENAVKHIKFFMEHPSVKYVSTRLRLHQELKKTYGGDDDTDGEGYESDQETKDRYQRIMVTK